MTVASRHMQLSPILETLHLYLESTVPHPSIFSIEGWDAMNPTRPVHDSQSISWVTVESRIQSLILQEPDISFFQLQIFTTIRRRLFIGESAMTTASRTEHQLGRNHPPSRRFQGCTSHLFSGEGQAKDPAYPHPLPLQHPVFQARSSCKSRIMNSL